MQVLKHKSYNLDAPVQCSCMTLESADQSRPWGFMFHFSVRFLTVGQFWFGEKVAALKPLPLTTMLLHLGNIDTVKWCVHQTQSSATVRYCGHMPGLQPYLCPKLYEMPNTICITFQYIYIMFELFLKLLFVSFQRCHIREHQKVILLCTKNGMRSFSL